jgi:polysaccharide biosynthesis transport protein
MEQTLKLEDYVHILRRRIAYFVIPFSVVLIGSVVTAFALPPLYRATGKILIESPSIPSSLVEPTVTVDADRRIAFLQQRIMTRDRLQEIIEKFHLYADKRDWPKARLVEHLRKYITIEAITDPYGRERNTVAFTVSFDDRDPHLAYEVANELVNLFLSENIKTRTAWASEATDFLREQAHKLSEQAAAIDAKVAKFKQEHSDALPEYLDLKVSMLNAARSNLQALQRDIASTEEEKRFLQSQQASVGAVLSRTSTAGRGALSPQQELAALKTQLIAKLGLYSPEHPDIRSLKRRIGALEQFIRSSKPGPGEDSKSPAPDPAEATIDSQIRSADIRLAAMRAQQKDIQHTIETLQAQIMETPKVESRLKDLTRSYNSAVKEYESLRSKEQQAALAQSLEDEKKAERFVLLDSPVVPHSPVWPKKRKVLGVGLALALGGGGGAVFLAENLDTAIRGPAMLATILGRRPLAVIPYIESSLDEQERRRSRRKWYLIKALAFGLLVVGTLVLLFAFYRPLHLFLGRLTSG